MHVYHMISEYGELFPSRRWQIPEANFGISVTGFPFPPVLVQTPQKYSVCVSPDQAVWVWVRVVCVCANFFLSHRSTVEKNPVFLSFYTRWFPFNRT